MKRKQWIAVDLDATLAHYGGWKGVDHIGEPINSMVARVKGWLASGIEVKIFTARLHNNGSRAKVVAPIKAWCLKHLGRELEVTNVKTQDMIELWDDRAVSVPMNGKQGVAELLMAAAATYKEKNTLYKANYQHIGPLLLAVFAHTGGMPELKTAEQLNRFYLIVFCLAKLQRYCSLFDKGGHKDSAHDLVVYAAMLEDMTKEMV